MSTISGIQLRNRKPNVLDWANINNKVLFESLNICNGSVLRIGMHQMDIRQLKGGNIVGYKEW